MSFNADKCFMLHITKKWKPTEYNYSLHNQVLEVTKDSNYLAVTISNDLSWANPISNITHNNHKSKPITQSAYSCIIYSCPKEVKATAYTTLVRPSL